MKTESHNQQGAPMLERSCDNCGVWRVCKWRERAMAIEEELAGLLDVVGETQTDYYPTANTVLEMVGEACKAWREPDQGGDNAK